MMTDPELLTRQKAALRALWNAETARVQAQTNTERERNQRISEANAAFEQVSQRSAELLHQVETEYNAAQGILHRVNLGAFLTSAPVTIPIGDWATRDPVTELTAAGNQARNIKNHLQARASELEQVRLFHSKLFRYAIVLAIIAGLVLVTLIAVWLVYLLNR